MNNSVLGLMFIIIMIVSVLNIGCCFVAVILAKHTNEQATKVLDILNVNHSTKVL